MADFEDLQDGKNFYLDVPQTSPAFGLKGCGSLEWGMKNRLARIFDPSDGHTLMLAIDHGYFQGPTTGLERIDVVIPPLIPFADALMLTRGTLRSTISAEMQKPAVLRVSGGQSILKELSNELVAVDIDDALRLNASALAVQVYIGGVHEHESIRNLSQVTNAGNRYGIPTLAVTGVGKELTRDARYLGLATRICAEMGAHVVKTYFCERNFERVAAGCPVPLVIAGGKKLPEFEALQMAYRAIQEGAAGVDMGRNIFQCEDPVAIVQAVRSVVHGKESAAQAYDLFHTLKASRRTSEHV